MYPDPDPAVFPSRRQQYTFGIQKKILLITFEGTFTSFFKDKK
jgi:hypothetical protein